MNNQDPHSFAEPEDAIVTHLNLDLSVDFNTKTLFGYAEWTIHNKSQTNRMFFDTKDLTIERVTIDGNETDFAVHEAKPFIGSALEIIINGNTNLVKIYYTTSPEAAAVQWLNPSQTAGGKPFLFTQSQAILARTWIPCQDSPGIRFSYSAHVKTPNGFLALMSATNPQEKNHSGNYTFMQPHAIPAYLMALAVGDLEFKPVGSRTGVYAEPIDLDPSVYEFADMESMLETCESLYGEYPWGRYDLLVLPPSFPFGGMENPCLTFCTPTILAGDRSLTSLVAHELAHSWSGNLVTNSTWNDFWLNEGFTMYVERRIMEALYGESYVDMMVVLGRQDLQNTIEDLGADSPDTCLFLNLKDRDPDDGMNLIAYEKGFFMLKHVANTIGKENFDAFLKKYFATFGFKGMDTERFITYFNQEIVKGDTALEARLGIKDWIFKPNLPETCPAVHSARFDAVDEAVTAWGQGTFKIESTKDWSTHEWLRFIRNLPQTMEQDEMEKLDATFRFTASQNCEIAAAWFVHVIRNRYEVGYDALHQFLCKVGRRKFLSPLYKELMKTEEGAEIAKDIYKEARPNYHSVAVSTYDEMVGV